MSNLYATNRAKFNNYVNKLDEIYGTRYSYINSNENSLLLNTLDKSIQNTLDVQNNFNLILSWKEPPKPRNYNLIKSKIITNNIKIRQNFIKNYLKNNNVDLASGSTINTPYTTSLSNTQIANTEFVQKSITNAIDSISSILDSSTTIETPSDLTLSNTRIATTEFVQKSITNALKTVVFNSNSEISLNFKHINTSTYDLSYSTYNNLVIETSCEIILPNESIISEGFKINIINRHSDSIKLISYGDTLIYNFFLQPNGGTSIYISSNGSFNLIFVQNITSSTNSWHVNFC